MQNYFDFEEIDKMTAYKIILLPRAKGKEYALGQLWEKIRNCPEKYIKYPELFRKYDAYIRGVHYNGVL